MEDLDDEEPTPVGTIDPLLDRRLRRIEKSSRETRDTLKGHIERDEKQLAELSTDIKAISGSQGAISLKLGHVDGQLSQMVGEMTSMRRISEMRAKGDITERRLSVQGSTRITLKLIALIVTIVTTLGTAVAAIVKYG